MFLIAVWAGLVIYPQWGLWAIFLLLMGHYGLRVFFWPLDQFWKMVLKDKNRFTQNEIARVVLLRMIPPFLACFVLMYLSVHWFGWWCFWALFITFVHVDGDNATRKA